MKHEKDGLNLIAETTQQILDLMQSKKLSVGISMSIAGSVLSCLISTLPVEEFEEAFGVIQLGLRESIERIKEFKKTEE